MIVVLAAGCAGTAPTHDGAAYGGSMCQVGQALVGVRYDVGKSRFAFGSKPVPEDAGGLVRWVGRDGVLAIFDDGQVIGILNAGAPEAQLATFSNDSATLKDHGTQYFVGLGVENCQIATAELFGSVGSTSSTDGASPGIQIAFPSAVVLSRGVDGIAIPDSNASATFVTGDLTTNEGLYWPEIPAAVVSDAVALRERLNDPQKLADYKALLPENARGDGTIMIHHTGASSTDAFRAVAVYEVELMLPPNTLTHYQTADFDAEGNAVEGWAASDL